MVTNYKCDLNEEQLIKLGKLIYGEDYKKTASRKDINALLDGFIDSLVDDDFELSPDDPYATQKHKKAVAKIKKSSGNAITKEDYEKAIKMNPELKNKSQGYLTGWIKVAKAGGWKNVKLK